MSILRFPAIKRVALTYLIVYVAVIWHYFPRRTEAPEAIRFQPTTEQQEVYDEAFDSRRARYERIAAEAARLSNIRGGVEGFVSQQKLENAHVLEDVPARERCRTSCRTIPVSTFRRVRVLSTTSGSCRLTRAPCLSTTASSMHCGASGCLEQVPNPEQALREIRRVLKPNGVAFLYPAWNCTDLAPEGYPVRPFSDFNFRGKLIKATVPIQSSAPFQEMYLLPIRLGRWTAWKLHGHPTSLHYRPIDANYREYWMSDSDAVNSLDVFEAYLWFRSRGDRCLNCSSDASMIGTPGIPLVIRKSGAVSQSIHSARQI